MLISKLKEINLEDIPTSNPSPKKYFLLTSNEDKNLSSAYITEDIAGQLIAIQLNKQLKTNFSTELFISKIIDHFKKKMNEEEYAEIIKDIYFADNNVPTLSPIMYMAKPYKSIDAKTKKSLDIFKKMLQKNQIQPELKVDLSFIEEEIYNIFHTFIETKQHDAQSSSYVNFLDATFTKDFLFLLHNQHYFKTQIDRFLKFYLFTYSAQLILNIHSAPLEKPKSQKLFFILNHEKASSERKNLTNNGYKTLLEKTRYMFPYLSLLESLTNSTKIDNLKLYHFNEIVDSEDNIFIMDELTRNYRVAKSLSASLIKSSSITEAFQTLLASTMEQFKTSNKQGVLERFVAAFEKQISGPFFQSRGRSGKVLVLDQDTILLLTNLAIGDKKQLRFQELMDEFRERSVYFDPKSEDALLELYERVGNVDRKSDSGDAVYVKSI